MFTLDENIIIELREKLKFNDILICNFQYLVQCLMNRFRSIRKVKLKVEEDQIILNTHDRFCNFFTFYILDIVYSSEFDIASSIETLYNAYEKAIIEESMR